MSGYICLVIIGALLAACASPPRREFNPQQKVQTIAVTNQAHIYAQNDVILDRSLDTQLAQMNDHWKSDLSRASLYRGIGTVAFIAQVLSLGVCVAQTHVANVLGWCGGSILMGAAITIPLSYRAEEIKFGVVNQYNQKN
jgi:hypothetical protein